MAYSHILYRKEIRDSKKKAESLLPAAEALGYAKELRRMIGAIEDHRIDTIAGS